MISEIPQQSLGGMPAWANVQFQWDLATLFPRSRWDLAFVCVDLAPGGASHTRRWHTHATCTQAKARSQRDRGSSSSDTTHQQMSLLFYCKHYLRPQKGRNMWRWSELARSQGRSRKARGISADFPFLTIDVARTKSQ